MNRVSAGLFSALSGAGGFFLSASHAIICVFYSITADHVHFGNGIYANSNLTLVDDGHIYVGDKVMFGPNVTVATANHPIEPSLRAKGLQYNKDVYIGENTWIGAGVIIVPGIRIGKNVVIGAGTIVTKDLPDNVVAVGNPCRILREVSERDKKYFYKKEPIDWNEINCK